MRARCVLDAALDTGACSDETVPRGIGKAFAQVAGALDQAAGSSPRKARRLRKRAAFFLRRAAHAATAATKGAYPKLSRDCAASLRTAVDAVRRALRS